ncbi:MAG: CDP-alcohol phosphatidyltransferase family protein [Patescibacteria group bacterium]|jgi:phosphatidylglycerophosphate synthase|nr:CDP-alcohol phosphatidyltransferase family protein [Patescibacteria group bacterium]
MVKFLICLGSTAEKLIEHSLEGLASKKEEVLIPWIRRCWPPIISPNLLTAVRFEISLVIILYLIVEGGKGYQANPWIISGVIIACLTDLIDGPVARALNMESKLGSWFDKVVDKFLILPLGTVEFWHIDRLLVILSISGTVVALIAATYKLLQDKEDVPENIFGKFGMNCYCLGIFLALWPACELVAWKIAWIGFAFGLASIIHNFCRHFGLSGPYRH